MEIHIVYRPGSSLQQVGLNEMKPNMHPHRIIKEVGLCSPPYASWLVFSYGESSRVMGRHDGS